MKISILTPSYNSAKYIKRAIESVLVQDYRNWEHIIVDGGSEDESIAILQSYPHLNWISEPDKGQSDAMNKAFEKSSGDVIIYLNADDELIENTLSKIVDVFRKNRQMDMLIGNLYLQSPSGRSLRKPSPSLIRILDYWPAKFPLNPVSYAYKRELQLRIGQFPIDNHYTMDYWFLLRVYLFGRIKKTELVLGVYHVDGHNKSANANRAKEELKKVRNDFMRIYFYRPQIILFVFYLGFIELKSHLRKVKYLFKKKIPS